MSNRNNTQNKLDICKQTRQFAADTLYIVLEKLLSSNEPISEVMLRDVWLAQMQKNKDIFPDGWYTPPPHGMIVLFGTDSDVERVNFLSVRHSEKWPREDIFLNRKNGIAYMYASPVDKESGIIGDFGMTLYFGKKKEIKELLKYCLGGNSEIFAAAHVGMHLGDVAEISRKTLKKHGMQNESLAITDKGTNVLGHTIPDGFVEWTVAEQKILKKNNWEEVKDIISKKRINVKDNEKFVILKNSGITIEPRPKTLKKPYLPTSLSYHTIAWFNVNGEKELLTGFDNLFTLVGMDYMIEPMKNQKISYEQAGVNYEAMDPLKVLAQLRAKATAKNLKRFGMSEVSASRGESAYIWEEPDAYRAFVIEGLGTKNLVADEVRKFTGKTHYNAIAQDTIAMIVNDLIVLGAAPQVVNAYFAVGDSDWFSDKERARDLVEGWAAACNLAGAVWGGGETPTLKGIIDPKTIDLGGSAVGIINPKERLALGSNLKVGDTIVLIESSGIHANGLTLARAIAAKLPQGYKTKLSDGTTYGETLLRPTHIYAKLVQDIFASGINPHYMVNITGHGYRKLMRASKKVSYLLHTVPPVSPLFSFIQEHSGNDDREMYGNFNMGAGFAFFVAAKDAESVIKVARKNKFKAWNAGFVKKGDKQVVIKPKDIIYKGETLQVRL